MGDPLAIRGGRARRYFRVTPGGLKALRAAGFSEQDLKRMFKDTPARLVGLPILQ